MRPHCNTPSRLLWCSQNFFLISLIDDCGVDELKQCSFSFAPFFPRVCLLSSSLTARGTDWRCDNTVFFLLKTTQIYSNIITLPYLQSFLFVLLVKNHNPSESHTSIVARKQNPFYLFQQPVTFFIQTLATTARKTREK